MFIFKLLFIFFISFNLFSNDKEISVGNSGGYFPFGFTEKKVLKGFEIDLMNAIAKEMGKKVKWEVSNFSGLFGKLETKRVVTIANQITITEERSKKYLFSKPYTFSGAQIFVKKTDKSIRSLEDLKGKKIGVQFGTNYESIIKSLPIAKELKIVTYETAAWQDVILGRIDAFVEDKIGTLELMKKNPKLKIKPVLEPLTIIEQGYPFLKNEKNEILVKEINQILEKMQKNGKLTKISKKWFSGDITKRN